MAKPQQLRVVRRPSSGIAGLQISAGTSDAVPAKSPSLLACFGSESSLASIALDFLIGLAKA